MFYSAGLSRGPVTTALKQWAPSAVMENKVMVPLSRSYHTAGSITTIISCVTSGQLFNLSEPKFPKV